MDPDRGHPGTNPRRRTMMSVPTHPWIIRYLGPRKEFHVWKLWSGISGISTPQAEERSGLYLLREARGELSMAESITAGFSRGVAGLDSPGLLGPGLGGPPK